MAWQLFRRMTYGRQGGTVILQVPHTRQRSSCTGMVRNGVSFPFPVTVRNAHRCVRLLPSPQLMCGPLACVIPSPTYFTGTVLHGLKSLILVMKCLSPYLLSRVMTFGWSAPATILIVVYLRCTGTVLPGALCPCPIPIRWSPNASLI